MEGGDPSPGGLDLVRDVELVDHVKVAAVEHLVDEPGDDGLVGGELVDHGHLLSTAGGVHDERDAEQADRGAGVVPDVGAEPVHDDAPRE